ncbi:MAG: RNA-binding domain-containing protein [Methanobacterium sp.]
MYPVKESLRVELKRELSDTFLKTVSAFANYGDGKIVFGVSADGTIVGVVDTEKFRLQLENKINDSIFPRPEFSLKTVELEGKAIVELSVGKGQNAPYLYSGRAYKRSDTSSTQLDSSELRRLSLDSSSMTFDQLTSQEENLSFKILERELQETVGLKRLGADSLRTLGLMKGDQYLRSAELLADSNDNAQSATIVVRFGKTNSEFMDRIDLTYQSLLSQYQGALDMFDKWYAPYEVVEGIKRVSRIQIPKDAYREAVANALIHRRYDQAGAVQIAMYQDRVEVTSPGGLPDGVSETAYLYSQISVPRNLIIAEVFHRLHLIEKFGTGIDRIRREYEPYASKPEFEITDVWIRVVLPVIDYNKKSNEISLEDRILLLIANKGVTSRAEIEKATGYGKTRVYQILNELVILGKLERIGTGTSVKYQIKT